MLTIDVRHNFADVRRQFEALRKDQMPFATAVALTKTAQAVKAAEIAEMQRAFDRPTPYTLGGLFVRAATKATLTAVVGLKDTVSRGTPAVKYLMAEIEGGRRRMKRFELALQRSGLMPSGYQAVPGAGIKLDVYGNIAYSELGRILTSLRGQGQRADRQRARQARGSRAAYGFVYFTTMPGKSHLPPGVWKRVRTGFGSAVSPIVMFVAPGHYPRRFKFYEVARQTVDRVFAAEFAAAAQRAMATAR